MEQRRSEWEAKVELERLEREKRIEEMRANEEAAKVEREK
jgi:hypothetical protein